MPIDRRVALCAAFLALAGAGCFPPAPARNIAEQLERATGDLAVSRDRGFGTLPALPAPQKRLKVALKTQLPSIPENITVIRPRLGTPNDVELRNISAALNIPSGAVSNHPSKSGLALEWTDEKGFRWSYRASDRSLEFAQESPPSGPLTVSTLPSNAAIINTANAFLLARGIRLQDYRDAIVEPDWNNWWLKAKAAGRCMDIASLAAVRAVGSSDPLVAGGPPPIPETAKATCVSPEFPSKLVVRYRALVDQRDVVASDGKYINGVELVVDTANDVVIGGRMSLYANPDRSDYPALSATEAEDALLAGGLSGASGDVTVTQIQFALYRLNDTKAISKRTYLIPSLLAFGTRVKSDGSIEPFRIVVPLLKP